MRALAGLGRRIAATLVKMMRAPQGKTGQEQGSKFHFSVSFCWSVICPYVEYVEYDSSRETVVNKYERT
jgi:hypothetical protein